MPLTMSCVASIYLTNSLVVTVSHSQILSCYLVILSCDSFFHLLSWPLVVTSYCPLVVALSHCVASCHRLVILALLSLGVTSSQPLLVTSSRRVLSSHCCLIVLLRHLVVISSSSSRPLVVVLLSGCFPLYIGLFPRRRRASWFEEMWCYQVRPHSHF